MICVLGEVMLDKYTYGRVERINPEAPVPIVSVSKRENRLGGAANVALNLKSLGANPIICSVLGEDDGGNLFYDLMKQDQLSIEGLVKSKIRQTTTKTRIISNGQQLLRVDEELTFPLKSEVETQLINQIVEIINHKNISAIIFEDYDKGVISEKLIQNVTSLANNKNIPIAVDPKKRNYKAYKNITLFKPNFKEFVEGEKLDISKTDIQAIFNTSKKIIDERNVKYLFVTLSELGVFICNRNEYKLIPAELRQITDVSGAGDTVISVATLLLSQGFDMETIASISNTAGGIVCERIGVVPIEKNDLSFINL